jgi:putative flippase GtrA
MTTQAWRVTRWRWFKFNLVGGIGIVVQLLILIVLKTGLGINYLVATALAVEGAVVHNFLWHERFTWPDRRSRDTGEGRWPRFLKFNLTTGALSIAGNLLLMKMLAGLGHMNYLPANGITIAACSVLNFLVSDTYVFAETTRNQSM